MPSPRRRGPRLRAFLLCALPLAACNDGDDGLNPQLRAPELGSYAYEALLYTTDSTTEELSGELEISVASEDTIIAAWHVVGFTGAPVRGVWNITAYTLPAVPGSIGGTISHRVWRTAGTQNLTCLLSYERVDMPADTFRSASENDCTLLRD